MTPSLFTAKYVIVEHLGLEVPVLVPANAGLAHAAAGSIGKPIAAGNCMLHTLGDGALGFTCDGISWSLGLKSREATDAGILDQYFLQGGSR